MSKSTIMNAGCNTASIAAYVPSAMSPWNESRVQHLFRRMAYGVKWTDISIYLAQLPTTVVDDIITNAKNLPLTPEPTWAYWNIDQYTDQAEAAQQVVDWKTQFLEDMISNGFRDRLTFFWSNHFVAGLEGYNCPSYMYQYHKVLQENALGNLKDFVRAVGITPAMLFYLNGVQNTRFEPNENYARELYELFTLGENNGYTQTDIEETARALTGYNGFTTACDAIGYLTTTHDPGTKTIFGQTGNWGYDDVIDILFQERGNLIAEYICGRLYRYFVSPDLDTTIISGLATTLLNNNFELEPVYRQLFKSEHFFDEAAIGVKIKSPIDSFLSFITEMNYNYTPEELQLIYFVTSENGQNVLDPPNVAGWQGDREWMTSALMTQRWEYFDYIVFNLFNNAPATLVDFARDLSNDSNDPAVVAQVIVDYHIPNGFDSVSRYTAATDIFKAQIPQNYYDDGSWNLNWDSVAGQVTLLLQHISRQPEFQLS